MGVMGFILGLISLNAINKSDGKFKGKGRAITGIVLGSLSVLGFIAGVVITIINPDSLLPGSPPAPTAEEAISKATEELVEPTTTD